MAGTSTGSTRWPTSDWQGLLRDAIRLLDTLKEPPKWTFGGGTALAVFYEHRYSYDVDIFLSNAEAVTHLSPARTPETQALLGAHGTQFHVNYLNLKLARGEIDFLLRGRRTAQPRRPSIPCPGLCDRNGRGAG